MVKVRSSRRAAGLKPADYDHEIGLVDRDEAPSYEDEDEDEDEDDGEGEDGDSSPRARPSSATRRSERHHQSNAQNEGRQEAGESLPHPSMQPSIEIQAPSPDLFSHPSHHIVPKRPRETRETAIDILYENERGGFMCGIPLFSSAALGGFDPPAWTNAYHKASPTNIYTAVVPDPSWEWVWPEWRINQQDGVDQGGWEYSFAFSKKFSWHRAKWWNSFVRRRAWIRKRAKRLDAEAIISGSLLGSEYFALRPTTSRSHRQSIGSWASSQSPSKSSMARSSIQETGDDAVCIQDVETLLRVLRSSRIDREKREAVDNYLDNAIDLSALQDEMHEIMSTFVFQTSRRQLLGKLMRKCDQVTRKLGQDGHRDDKQLLERRDALQAALKHANEEVAKLVYWSDVKKMAEGGELRTSLDEDESWYDMHPGMDRSGPAEPNGGELPGRK